MNDPTFAEKLKAWRLRKKLSQSQAAAKLGVPSVRTLQEWEQGRAAPRGIALTFLLQKIAPRS